MSERSDLTPFDLADPDSAKIARGLAVPCRICEAVARRLRLTRRYCTCCERAFCGAEHGGLALGGRGPASNAATGSAGQRPEGGHAKRRRDASSRDRS
jgi:hypothetical protein